MRYLIINTLIAAASIASGANTGKTTPATDATGQTGTAAFYSTHMDGRTTASGQKFNSNAMTAAHRELPLGKKVKITNLANNRSVIVTVNDRGPFMKTRDISVTRRAAQRLGFIKSGTTQVRIEPVS